MHHLLSGFSKDQSGATAIEYGLIGSLIFVVVVGSIAALGNGTDGLFARVANTVVPALDKALGEGEGEGEGSGPAEGDG